MTQWEYKVIHIADFNTIKEDAWRFSEANMQDHLNKLGVEGWELIAVPDKSLYYFKRKLS